MSKVLGEQSEELPFVAYEMQYFAPLESCRRVACGSCEEVPSLHLNWDEKVIVNKIISH